MGNNLANSNTVGFKSSTASFATQFLQTRNLGSGPTAYSGGTNPTQVGLGTMVADITPNFSQGTVSISSNPTDMAIQGDGFFIVDGSNGGYAYTRNGQFKMNAQNQLTTSTGNRVLGYGVNAQYEIQTNQLVPLTIPLGSAEVASATANVTLSGTLPPTSTNLADAGTVLQTGVLGDALYTAPTTLPTTEVSGAKDITGIKFQPDAGGGAGNVGVGSYYYKFVLSDGAPGGSIPLEGTPSANMTTAVQVSNAKSTVAITGFDKLLNASSKLDGYQQINIYRTDGTADANGNYDFLGSVTEAQANTGGFTFSDTYAVGGTTPPISLDEDVLNGQYQYYIAFGKSGSDPSRPIESQSLNPVNGRIHITDLSSAGANPNGWDSWIIYRNVQDSSANGRFFQVAQIPFNTTTPYFTDSTPDSTLYSDSTPHTAEVDLDGPKIQKNTLLSNVLQRNGSDYTNLFPSTGILEFTGYKGAGNLATKDLTLTASMTVGDLLNFMQESLGIQSSNATNGIPQSVDLLHTTTPPTYIAPGADVVNGQIQITGNNGTANAINVTALNMVVSSSDRNAINLAFNKYQDAEGQSTYTSTQVYDSLGIACQLNFTAVLQSSDSTATTYRWFADSPDNQLASGAPNIAVGTGLIKFDGNGNFIGATQDQIDIYRSNVASNSPLQFKLNFNSLSGLAADTISLKASADGSAPGTLTSYIVGENGLITGVFDNGAQRDLGQIRLASFGNPAGLEQLGQNMYATGVNSGQPIEGNPGEQGIGSIVSGAVELSNADVGGNLIDLILASTMYRANTKVITTVQTMLDTLLQLQR